MLTGLITEALSQPALAAVTAGEAWGRYLADTSSPARRIDAAGSGYGAALLGWHALGELPSLTDAAWSRPDGTVTPDTAVVRRMAETRHLSERAYQLLRDMAS
jgi:sugar (pentulose or hexulose) kinase